MALITYADKVFLNENQSIADINKVKDIDMNEIKNVVNENAQSVGDISSLLYGPDLVSAINDRVLLETVSCTRMGGTKPTGAWANMYYDATKEIQAGTYIVIATGGISATANGMITSRLQIDGVEAFASRSTIPLQNGLASSYIITTLQTFESTESHTFNVSGYTNALCTINSNATINFIKIL